jgi:hypothetical protein
VRDAHLAPAPLPVGETGGSKGKGGRGGGGSPCLHKRIAAVEALPATASARKVGETAPAGLGSSGTSPLPARGAEPHGSSQKKGAYQRSASGATRGPRDRLTGQPQERQHSADAACGGGTRGPTAPGERLNRASFLLTCCAMGLKATDRDASRLGSRTPGAEERRC